jgi:hypothetical protein
MDMPLVLDRTLHPNVQLAEGVIVPDQAWALHGNVLCNGLPGHRVRITGFTPADDGQLTIHFSIWPLDGPEPLRTRES